MKIRKLAIVLFTALMAGGLAAQQAPSADVQLKAARQRQQVDGDLAGAIKQYQVIVDRFQKTNRSVAATALVYMAECHQKLGNAEAQKIYERVVREFGDLSQVAAAARSGLSAMNTASSPASPPTLAMRRLYDGPGLDWCNGLSSDARLLSHIDWSTGDIAVADLRNSQVRRITKTGGINQSRGEYGECSVFSPDDKQLAYFWDTRAGKELRIIGTDGSRLRTVFRSPHYLQPLDWSADGRTILVDVSANAERHLVTVHAGDGTARVVKRMEPGGGGAGFSPDGRFIAYAAKPAVGSAKSDLFIMRADGTQDSELVRHPAEESILGWAPDGSRVFFLSDRTGSNGVWSIGVENGQPRGAPVLAKRDVGAATGIRFLNGALYYMTRSDLSDIHLAASNPVTGLLESTPAPAKRDFTTSNFAPDWSPDGTLLAYRSIPGGGDQVSGSPALVSILNVNTKEERHVRPELGALDFNDGPQWSPDGRSLLVIARQGTPEIGVYKVDAATGATTPLVKAPRGQYLLHARWSRDGKSVFYTIGNPPRIVRRDLATGVDRDLVGFQGEGAGLITIALSPDGRSLAFTARVPGIKMVRTVSVMSSEGGEPKEIYRGGEEEGLGSLVWTSDGKYVFFAKRTIAGMNGTRAGRFEYWRVRPDGGAAEKLALDIQSRWVRFSPDGRRVAFTSGESKAELWTLENLAAPGGRR
jgi:Tol biopolymer transport system component